MSLNVTINVSDDVTPALSTLTKNLTGDRTDLHEYIAYAAGVMTQRYITEDAAPTRHRTANRLGASPTNYLARTAAALEFTGTRDAAVLSFGRDSEIYARVNGPVTVRPVNKKFITIPATAAAYGKRAREFSFLKFIPFANGTRALARVDGKGKAKKLIIFYWLKEQVTLPQDRGLLPSDTQFLDAAELGARDFVEHVFGK